jgi:hypothetical protein
MLCRGCAPKINAAVFDAIRGRTIETPQAELAFTLPPQWIHESLAAKVLLGKESPLLISRRREAKRRALLQMLDRIPVRAERPAPIANPAGVPASDVPRRRTPALGIRGRTPL